MIVICQWFAACTREAHAVVTHPVLGYVPTCQACAEKLDLELIPAEFEEA
jgi:hypothetical protein